MADTKQIVQDVLLIYTDYAGNDRIENLDVVAAMLGAVMAVLNKNAHPEDCVNIVERAMVENGWKKP